MDQITVRISDPEAYDKAVHEGLSDGGDLSFITKDYATEEGRSALVVTFTVQLPDGSLSKAQSATTVRNFLMAAQIIQVKYTNDGYLREEVN